MLSGSKQDIISFFKTIFIALWVEIIILIAV